MTDPTAREPRPRRLWRRRTLLWGGSAGLIPALLVVAMLFGLQRVAVERLVPVVGRSLGLDLSVQSVDRLDFGRTEITGIQLLPGLSAQSAAIDYDLSDPSAPRLQTAEVHGLHLHLILDDGGLRFTDGSLVAERVADLGGAGDVNAVPAAHNPIGNARIAVTGGQLQIDTADGPLTARIDGTLVMGDGRIAEAALTLADVAGYGTAGAAAIRAMETADGRYDLALTVEERPGDVPALALAFTGALSLPAGDDGLAVSGTGTLTLPGEPILHLGAQISRGTTVSATLDGNWTASDDAPPGRLPRQGRLAVTLSGDPERPCGTDGGLAVSADGTLDDWADGVQRFGRAQIALAARAELCDDTIRVAAMAPSRLEITGFTQPASGVTVDRMTVAWTAGTELLSGDPNFHRLRAVLGPLQASGTATVPFSAGFAQLAVEAGTAIAPTLAITDGHLALPAQEIMLDGLNARFAGNIGAAGLAGHLAIDSATVTDTARDRRVAAPFAMHGGADLTPEGIGFTARIDEPSGTLAFDVEGRHDLTTSSGQARVTMTPLTFGGRKAGMTTLVPALAGRVANLRGGLAGHAALTWGPRGWNGTAELAFDDFGATTPQVELTGITGTLRLSGLNPPQTKPGQSLTIRQVLVGLGVGPVDLRFALRRDGKLSVEHASWPFYGGRIVIDGALLDPAAKRNTMQVRVEGIDLEQVAALSGYAGILASGRVSGTVPVVIDETGPQVVGGRLEADRPGGTFQLRDADLRNMVATDRPELDFVFDVLTDFHFSVLSATVDGPLNGNLKVGLEIVGLNPAIEGGQPVAFNLSVEGPLRAMAQSGASLYNLGNTIGQRIIGGRTKGNGQ